MVDPQVGGHRVDPGRAVRTLPLDNLGRAAPKAVAGIEERPAVGPRRGELRPVAALPVQRP